MQLCFSCSGFSIVALATPHNDLIIVIFVLSELGDVLFDLVLLILKSLEPLYNY
jgi:hypothetical protein